MQRPDAEIHDSDPEMREFEATACILTVGRICWKGLLQKCDFSGRLSTTSKSQGTVNSPLVFSPHRPNDFAAVHHTRYT